MENTPMTEKPKRKNAPPTPKAYWWLFGTLAFVLLIGLRYPIRFLPTYGINALLYMLMTASCALALFYFVLHYYWKRMIVIAMVVCICLALLNTVLAVIFHGVDNKQSCTIQHTGIFTNYTCEDGLTYTKAYGLRGIPIVITTAFDW
jgi:hypothetical protein